MFLDTWRLSCENLKFLESWVTALWPAIYATNATDKRHQLSGLGSWCGWQKGKADGKPNIPAYPSTLKSSLKAYSKLSNLSIFDWPRSHFYRNSWLVPPKTPTSHIPWHHVAALPKGVVCWKGNCISLPTLLSFSWVHSGSLMCLKKVAA